MRPERSRGFTLVELLVVIAIIALLISILLPSLAGAKEQAKVAKCLANLQDMGRLVVAFSNDHNGHFQLAANGNGMAVAGNPNVVDYDEHLEPISWIVAMARTQGIPYEMNLDWGVRAWEYSVEELQQQGGDGLAAEEQEQDMSTEFQAAMCPAHEYRNGVASPWYPDHTDIKWVEKVAGGFGYEPFRDAYQANAAYNLHPVPYFDQVKYWGYLSYAINEDIAGADPNTDPEGFWVKPGCFRTDSTGQTHRGDYSEQAGARLLGKYGQVFDPSSAIFLVDGGIDSPNQEAVLNTNNYFVDANLITSWRVPSRTEYNDANGWGTGDNIPATQIPFFDAWEVGAAHLYFRTRLPNARHPGGQLNTLMTDFHAEAVIPKHRINSNDPETSGLAYSYGPTRARISPYPPGPSDYTVIHDFRP
jgi:prepilin-type N-terminal cleavage/methylation domain-containing protein